MRDWVRTNSVCLLTVGIFAGLLLAASTAAAQNGSDATDSLEIPGEKYYTKPVQWMTDNDIVTDTTPACFGPDIPATRGETALYIWRIQGRPDAPAHPFRDVTDDQQQPAVSWLSSTEITTGATPTTFAPDEQLTRAQVAALLHRLADQPSAAGHPFTDVSAGWQQQPVA
ncbi:MAG: S-layer homology domain-containing protein [Acidimicrobiaceae bacterium]|nr:S-layer homology domain-containing protein [Acidimicrobiaceae bacterium]